MGHAHAFPAARAHKPVGVAELDLFGQSEARGLTDVHFRADPATGLRAIITIHGARLGPAIGCGRRIRYDSFAGAVLDAAPPARATNYKAAIRGLPCGGGKAVQRLCGNQRQA